MSENPEQAIPVACTFTRYYFHCMESLSSLHAPLPKIHASDIFRLSIQAPFRRLAAIPPQLASKMGCRDLLSDSLSRLNRSMIIMISQNRAGPDVEILDFDDGVIGELRDLVDGARREVGRCLEERESVSVMREEIMEIEIDMLISLDILEKKDLIREVFDPSLQSVLASFMLSENYVVSIGVLCSQYVFLAFLICSLVRAFK